MQEDKIPEMRSLTEGETNHKVPMQDIQQRYPEYVLVPGGFYFPYNHIHEDCKWGCAWRAIQTMLSSFNIETDFRQLVTKYSSKQLLTRILTQDSPLNQELSLQISHYKWAPQQNSYYWAQPFICHLVLKSHSIPSQLLLVNGYPSAHAPQLLFPPPMAFPQFWQLLTAALPRHSVMIDDGQIALTVVGCRQMAAGRKGLVLADPHIRSNRVHRRAGVYAVVLDSEGRQASNDVGMDEIEEYMFGTQAKIEFAVKKWMCVVVTDDKPIHNTQG